MAKIIQPWHVLLAALAGWITRHQQLAIDDLRGENRILIWPPPNSGSHPV